MALGCKSNCSTAGVRLEAELSVPAVSALGKWFVLALLFPRTTGGSSTESNDPMDERWVLGGPGGGGVGGGGAPLPWLSSKLGKEGGFPGNSSTTSSSSSSCFIFLAEYRLGAGQTHANRFLGLVGVPKDSAVGEAGMGCELGRSCDSFLLCGGACPRMRAINSSGMAVCWIPGCGGRFLKCVTLSRSSVVVLPAPCAPTTRIFTCGDAK